MTDTSKPDPCPPWCVSDHAQDSPGSPLWCHRTAKVVLAAEIASGEERFTWDFHAGTVQYPHARPPQDSAVHVWADLAAVGRLMRPADVIAAADALTSYANRLREVADELVILQGRDGRE